MGEGMNLPTSFNVMNAFVEPDEKTLVLRLLPERHYSLSFSKLLDRITDPTADNSIKTLSDELEELTIYELSLIGGYAGFRVPGQEDYVFCGFACCREGSELSVMGVFGKSNRDPREQTITVKDEDINPDKPFLRAKGDTLDVTDETLFGDESHSPVILMTRIDTENDKVQVRYVLLEKKDTFLVLSDDPQTYEFLLQRSGPDRKKAAEEYLSRLEKFNALFELTFAAPLCLDLMDSDSVVVTRHPTKLRLQPNKRDTKYVRSTLPLFEAPNYVDVLTYYDLGTGKAGQLPASELELETTGYWKTLPLGSVGKDRNGNIIQGKTWVTQQTSWYEGVPNLSDPNKLTKIEPVAENESVGYLYVMRSPQHPRDLYKIGFTTKDPEDRAKQLTATTGQPDMFSVVQSWKVRSPRLIEHHVHELLREYRVNSGREFFLVKYDKIRLTIDEVISAASALVPC